MGLGLACLWHMLGRGCPHWPTVCLTPEEASVPVHAFPVTEAVSQHIHLKEQMHKAILLLVFARTLLL